MPVAEHSRQWHIRMAAESDLQT
ncbi:hypothetical protein CBM2600_B10654 [Cupriavidus taiwanensis]|nr:hypothetical protein CBM2600_B10654 [Cupriavidus taiwanensis]